MAITVIKDYTFPFAKNDDYIYLSSDKTEETQFRYGLHYLYDEVITSNVGNNRDNFNSGYIDVFTTNSDILNYGKYTSIYLDAIGINFIQYNPVCIVLEKVVELSANNYRLFLDTDKLKKDSWWWWAAFSSKSGSIQTASFNIYRCITKKVAANTDGYGVFSINDINRNLIENNILDLSSNDKTVKFKYLPFEEYLVKLEYDLTTITSSTSNQFKATAINVNIDKLSFGDGDDVIVESDNEAFYNGTQKCTFFNFGATDWIFNTNKPALFGTSNSGGVVYRADFEATPLTDESDISTERTAFLSGLKLADVSGLSDVELTTLQDEYLNGNKYFSYAPKLQNTYLNDLGYLTLANTGAVTITYTVTDSANVEHIYTLDLNNTDDVYKIASNPASINDVTMTTNAARGLPVIQECDKFYTIDYAGGEQYKFNLLNDTKYERVRLLFADLLGSLNGFNFSLFNAKIVSTKKDTFTKDINNFSSLNTIKYNNTSRGKTDVATFVSYKLKLNSDFLTQDESNYFEDLLTSNNVYAQYKGDIHSVNISDNSVTIKEKVNGLIRYNLEVEFSIKNTQW